MLYGLVSDILLTFVFHVFLPESMHDFNDTISVCHMDFFLLVVATMLITDFCHSSASVLQPQHSGDVRQHPEQAAAAETQHFQRSQTPAGGPAAEGPNQEAGLHRGLCKCLVT